MNIKGISLVAGMGGDPELVTNDVYGAMGFSGLSAEAYIIGSAYVNRDSYMVNQAVQVATNWVGFICEDLQWSLTRPYHSRVGCGEKARMGALLKQKLALMAIAELLSMAVCQGCQGSGEVKNRRHRPCGGTGKATLRDVDRAEFCDIKYNTWLMTWQLRYRTIQAMMTEWVNEFTAHLEEKC